MTTARGKTARRGSIALLATGAALAAALAGCGEDGEQVSAPELIAKGDELCRQGQTRFEQIQADVPVNAIDAHEQTEELVDVASEELEELRRLRPPDELSDAYERYLEARGSALELLEQGRDAAADRDADAYAEAQSEVSADQPERMKLASAVGFQVCSRADGSSG